MIAAEPRSGSARTRVRNSRAAAALAARLRPLALLLVGVAALGSEARAQPTPVDFTVAFIGDQGLGSNAEAVLSLILGEGADAVVHSGDFDYQDDPPAWDDQIDRILGPEFPYFASAGNHDTSQFDGPGGYQELLAARMNRLGIAWSGDLGVQSSHHYQGIFFVLTAAGVFGGGDGLHDLYIRNELAADDSIWSVSSWHKNMRLMQVGGKSDDTGWGVYEESRRGGAIIATAHEHSYSRTHLMSSMEQQIVANVENTLVLEPDDLVTPGDEGRSFAFVSGLGGKSIRDQELSGPWWASIYTSTQGANHGALFGVFNFGGDPRLAHFYFRDIDGVVADEFFVQSTLGDDAPVAHFSVAVNVQGSGTVTLDPPGGTYDADTVVTLTAAPVFGHAFAGWSGDLIGTANPTTLTVDADKSVAATFTAAPRRGRRGR